MERNNLSRLFYVEYFNELFAIDKKCEEDLIGKINELHKEIKSIGICAGTHTIPDQKAFKLQVEYPGLMAGIGYPHAAGRFKGEIAGGFSLDYVTGSPYLPGSSVKGVLRSAFKQPEYIRELLNDSQIDIKKLESEIFDGADVFLDVYPVDGTANGIIELENITPHHSKKLGVLSDPDILSFLKIKPDVVFEFRFVLKDGAVSADKKLKFFKQILLDFGAGAKTNVGFGRFTDKIREITSSTKYSEGLCQNCGKPTGINKNTGKSYQYCSKCSNEADKQRKNSFKTQKARKFS